MKRDYKETYNEIFKTYENCADPDKYNCVTPDNLGDLFNDLIDDRPSDDVISYFDFVFNDAKLINKFGLIDYCKTIDDDRIVALCEKFADYEFWARCFDRYDWYSVVEFNKSKEYKGEIAINLTTLQWKAKNIKRVFDYYHGKAKPRHDIKKMASDTLNDERADERAAGGLQAAKPQLPEALATPEALEYWEKAKGEQLIKEDYSFNGTNYERAEFADMFSARLGIRHKWKYFQQLWNCKGMATDYLQGHNTYITADFDKMLNKVFG